MIRVLITGCSGFLGRYLTEILNKEKNNVIYGITEVLDFSSDLINVYHVDLRFPEKVFEVVKEINPDIVFHLAAISNVGFSWKNQKLTYEVNLIGSSNLIEAVDSISDQARLIMMSSAEVYHSTDKLLNEKSRLAIKNPYALSKYAMELLANFYVSGKGADIITVRSFNFTGPGQSRRFVASDFASQIAEIEKGKREPVIKVGNLSAARDFSDVRDIARYLNIIYKNGKKGGVYNLCSGKTYTIERILNLLLKFSHQKITVKVDEKKFRPVDIPCLSGDCSSIKREFNLLPEYKIEETLLDLLNYWRHEI